jgi:uncharacterized protein YbgA (DUF1722 family)
MQSPGQEPGQTAAGILPMVRHHLRRHNVSYLAGQVYLRPHPAELMLRNHV